MSELRLLTYNIRALRDDADAVADVVRSVAPDVVCVQEAPRFLRWRSKRAALARACGLVVATADRPAGLMLMCSLRVKVLGTGFRTLSKSPDLHQRGVCFADVVVDGAAWRIASVHMSLDADERRRHLPEVWAALDDGTDLPLVVAGDVNETPADPTWQQLATRLQDGWSVGGSGGGNTYSARDPRTRIDGVFADRRLTVVECRAVDDAPLVALASDHLPVLAVLQQRRQG